MADPTDYRARILAALREGYGNPYGLNPSNAELKHEVVRDEIVAIFRELTRDLSEKLARLTLADADRAARELTAPVPASPVAVEGSEPVPAAEAAAGVWPCVRCGLRTAEGYRQFVLCDPCADEAIMSGPGGAGSDAQGGDDRCPACGGEGAGDERFHGPGVCA